MSKSILSAQDLSKVVPVAEGELTLLHPLSLDLKAGDSLAIVGSSGSGKSTLSASKKRAGRFYLLR